MFSVETLSLILLFVSIVYVVFTLFENIRALAVRFCERGEAKAARQMRMTSLALSPKRFFVIRVSCTVVMFLIGMAIINWGLGLLLGWFGYLAPGYWLKRVEEKRLKRLTEQLVDGLELMGNALKSGLTLPQAIELLVRELPPPLSEEFQQVLAENRLGLEIQQALKNMALRLELPVITILSTGVSVTQRCGGDLTEIFQSIADTIRARAEIEGKIQAVSSLGRFQGMVLSLMPFILMGALFFIDRAHVEMLFEFKIGLAAVAAVVGLVIAANFWIGWILKIDI